MQKPGTRPKEIKSEPLRVKLELAFLEMPVECDFQCGAKFQSQCAGTELSTVGDFVPQGTSGNAYRLCGCHRMLQASRWWEILLDTGYRYSMGLSWPEISLEPRMRISAVEIRFKSFRSQVWASLGENHSREGTDLSSQQEYTRKWF